MVAIIFSPAVQQREFCNSAIKKNPFYESVTVGEKIIGATKVRNDYNAI